MGKASSKSWTKNGNYCTARTLSCNRWTVMWFLSVPKMTSQTKETLFRPLLTMVKIAWHFYFSHFWTFSANVQYLWVTFLNISEILPKGSFRYLCHISNFCWHFWVFNVGYSTQMVRYCLFNPQISSYIDMERKPSNLIRKGSNMVTKLCSAIFLVIWAWFMGYKSDKNTLVVLSVTDTANYKAIQDGSWVGWFMKWLYRELILITETKT